MHSIMVIMRFQPFNLFLRGKTSFLTPAGFISIKIESGLYLCDWLKKFWNYSLIKLGWCY